MFTEKISKNLQDTLEVLSPALPIGTYLAGGTALALHINHRQSYDLDLYTPIEFDINEQIRRFHEYLPHFVPTRTSWQSLFGKVNDSEISIFYYNYKMIDSFSNYQDVRIASIKDIAAMKIEAIAGRGLKRDYYDIYSICQAKKYSLTELVIFYQNKFGFDKSVLAHIIKCFTYFKDAETKSERAKIIDKDWTLVKSFFKGETIKLYDFLND